MSKKALDMLQRKFGNAIAAVHSERGDDTAVVQRSHIVDVCRYLKETPELAFDMPLDVTAVDYLTYPEPKPCPTRFEVVYHLRSVEHRTRVRLKVQLDDAVPSVDSVTSVYEGLRGFAREAYDMFGIQFKGHPDLRRILLYPEFQGHPLRKDYPVRGYQPPMEMPTVKGDPVPGVHTSMEEE